MSEKKLPVFPFMGNKRLFEYAKKTRLNTIESDKLRAKIHLAESAILGVSFVALMCLSRIIFE